MVIEGPVFHDNTNRNLQSKYIQTKNIKTKRISQPRYKEHKKLKLVPHHNIRSVEDDPYLFEGAKRKHISISYANPSLKHISQSMRYQRVTHWDFTPFIL